MHSRKLHGSLIMPTVDCPSTNPQISSKPVAQTLFLGASVSSFSANMGWGGQPSSVSITLVEDLKCENETQPVFKSSSYDSQDNHYYTCTGDGCYMDENGQAYTPPTPDPRSGFVKPKQKLIPGKIYYKFTSAHGFASNYWKDGDPGFFATGTTIGKNGGPKKLTDTAAQLEKYDIIGTPVYFKMQDFAFAGLVQSWEQDVSTGGVTYRITLEGPDNILNNSWIIIGEYAGSVFNKGSAGSATNPYGAPISGSDNNMSGLGTLKEGAIHNVFNVYGFLESMGIDYFGGSNLNNDGLKAKDIIQALKVLTSSVKSGTSLPSDLDTKNKNRFSPFGRILVKALAKESDLSVFKTHEHGIIPAFNDAKGKARCQCVLDLEELPEVPDAFRISGSVISIMDLVRTITDEAGYDFYWEMIPVSAPDSGSDTDIVSVIKLHTVSRRFQPSTSTIAQTINDYYNAGLSISTATVGKEHNPSNVRSLLFGPSLQRLYQAKSYRLGYKQSNYIYEPRLQQFIDYTPLGTSLLGKMRLPTGYSQRNPDISDAINGSNTTDMLNVAESFRGAGITFSGQDPKGAEPWGGANNIKYGNYAPIEDVNSFAMGNRFIPLYEDIICPFFGYQNEDNVTLSTGNDNNVFGRVRPVWLDTWTGQLNVVMYTSELPITNISLATLYNSAMFSITESEIRSAMIGSEEYLIYCLEKIFKPDLFLMLLNAYKAAGHPISEVFSSWEPQPNAAGPNGNPAEPSPDQADIMGGNFDIFLHPNFLRDFDILHNFVSNLGRKYYGQKYLVRMPTVRAYRDQKYYSLPAMSTTYNVYQGSGKIFYNYEPCDEAWEEQGNIIDDTISVGSVDYFSLANDNGCLPALVGYNASDIYDRIRHFLCTLSRDQFIAALGNNALAQSREELHTDLLVQWQSAKAGTGGCDVNKFIIPGLDVSSLASRDYVVKLAQTHPDAFGISVPGHNIITNPAAPATPVLAKKLYVKTQAENTFAFLYPETLDGPRVIMDAPGLNISSPSLSYELDPNRTIIANVAIEDLGIYLKAVGTGQVDQDFVKYMLHYCSPVFGGSFLRGNPFNMSSRFPSMAPKAAHPIFAAIPVKSKVFCYGPWTNYTDLIKSEIFPGASNPDNGIENLLGGIKVEHDSDLAPWNYGGMSLVDTVAFKKIQNNANYQPVSETGQIQTPGLPIFGIGSAFNFRARQSYDSVSTTAIIHNNVLFTRDSSTTITYTDKKIRPNPLPPSIQDMFGGRIINPPTPQYDDTTLTYNIITLSAPDEAFAPIITSISISFGREITSTYSFRTHTRKLSLFNKTEVDRIKESALQNIKRNKQIASQYSSLTSSINEQKDEVRQGLGGNKSYSNLKGLSQRNKFYDWSPGVVMVGGSYPFIPNQFIRQMSESSRDKAEQSRKKAKNDPDAPDQVTGVTLRYGADPGDNAISAGEFTAKPYETLFKMHKRRTFVGSYQPAEAKSELSKDYAMKSVMSMDGLFSPVSFYPTWACSTYHMLLYDKDSCPYCNGTQKIPQENYNYKTKQKETVDYKCPYCGLQNIPTGISKTQLKKSAEALPPYIVASGTDISTLLSMESSSGSSGSSSGSSNTSSSSSQEGVEIPINMFSLQPIVVPYGNFRNPNADKDSRCRHSIQVVGRGAKPPKNAMSFCIYSNYGEYYKANGDKQKPNENGQGYNIDFYEYDLANGGQTLMNQRFLGLRGPLMLHAWGYDTEGYPIPNAADEPKEFDAKSRPKRFVLKITRTDKTYSDLKNGDLFEFPRGTSVRKYVKRSQPVIVQDNGAFREIADADPVSLVEIENDPASQGAFEATGNIVLGDIIGKGWSLEGGKWVKKKDKKFYKDWAERCDLWPVGPIDLRWDETRRVWATASDTATIYKFVYVTLEEDLVKEDYTDETYPARGFLDDVEYSTDPLDQNYRRLVLVKDKAGYTAPRGAKLLCRYNSDNGFYEPITKPAYIVKGIINNGSQATLEMSYIQGKKRGEINPTMLVTFDNPFGFNIIYNNMGMFSFNAGKWTLIATKES